MNREDVTNRENRSSELRRPGGRGRRYVGMGVLVVAKEVVSSGIFHAARLSIYTHCAHKVFPLSMLRRMPIQVFLP